MEFTRLSFDQDDVANVLAKLPPSQLDELPFGAIELDANGRILQYNATESKLSGRAVESVIGRLFFDEVAPCTRRPEFYGRFLELVKGGPSAVFDYVFDYKMRPRQVRVHMKRALLGKTYWILVRWNDGAGRSVAGGV
ncbi:photoactive yellow protein [Sandaracinus amylolyticus]|uniref:Photoactive yellow protein n=1 Tax=Sandaracinus amylolyticus TaxID=927083 RepID=A0A0F6VZI3_9BACT|nr:photoactive yellow protein [Sandaracinus amylolyticus]AKF03465.1 Photoactive yellow protein [Sandaracinus amylolyticus]